MLVLQNVPVPFRGIAGLEVKPSDTDTGMSKWTLTGTTREGTRKEVQGCDFYTFRDGKVIRKDSYWKIVE